MLKSVIFIFVLISFWGCDNGVKKEVKKANHTPIIKNRPLMVVDENKSYDFIPIAYDEDNDTLTFSIKNRPSWATFNTKNGELKGRPSFEDAKEYKNIILSVSDGKSSSSIGPFTITVKDVPQAKLNHKPKILSKSKVSVNENQLSAYVIRANDEDGDTLSYSISGADANSFNVDSSKGIVTFKSKPDYESGKIVYNFTAIVSDGIESVSKDIIINILDVNETTKEATQFLASNSGNFIKQEINLNVNDINTIDIALSNPTFKPLPTNDEIKNSSANGNLEALKNYPNGYIDANNIFIKKDGGKNYLYNLSYSKFNDVIAKVVDSNGSISLKRLHFNTTAQPQTVYEIGNLANSNITIIKTDAMFNSKVRFYYPKDENICVKEHNCTGSKTIYRRVKVSEQYPILGFFANMHKIYNSIDLVPIFNAWAYRGKYEIDRNGVDEIDFSNFDKPCSNFDECKIDENNSVPTLHDVMKIVDLDTQKAYLYRSLFRASSNNNRVNLKILEYKEGPTMGVGGTSNITPPFGDKLIPSSSLALRKILLVDMASKFKDILMAETTQKYDKNGKALSNPLTNKDYNKYKKTDEYKKRFKKFKDDYNITKDDEINSAIYEVGNHEYMHSFGFGHSSGMTYGFSTALKEAIMEYFNYKKPQVLEMPNIIFQTKFEADNNLTLNFFSIDKNIDSDNIELEILSPKPLDIDFYKRGDKVVLHFKKAPTYRFFIRAYDKTGQQVMSKLIYPLEFSKYKFDKDNKEYFLVSFNQWRDIVTQAANYARMLGNNGDVNPDKPLLSDKIVAKEASSICKGWSGNLNATTANLDDIPLVYRDYLKQNAPSKKIFSNNNLYDLTNYNYKDGDKAEQLPTPISYNPSDELYQDDRVDDAYILCQTDLEDK